MDKATPTLSPASYDSVMAMHQAAALLKLELGEKATRKSVEEYLAAEDAFRAEVERLAAQAAPPMRLVGHCWMEPRGTLRLAETDPPPAGSFPIYTPAAQPSAQAEQSPVVQAVQATEKGNWWCAHCGVFVMPVEVTFTERHDPEAGGCGFSVSASSGATPADVRMLTPEELDASEAAWGDANGGWIGEHAILKFCAVNAGKRIPASGVIGGV